MEKGWLAFQPIWRACWEDPTLGFVAYKAPTWWGSLGDISGMEGNVLQGFNKRPPRRFGPWVVRPCGQNQHTEASKGSHRDKAHSRWLGKSSELLFSRATPGSPGGLRREAGGVYSVMVSESR